MDREIQPCPGELEGLRLEEGRQKSQQRARKRTSGKGGRSYPQNILPVPVLDGRGNADWFGRHENVRFQENSG